jgi:membrane protease YdiL (CAAX protease family)
VPLAIEISVVTIGAITAIRLLNTQHALDLEWLTTPCLLVIAALLPAWLRKEEFPCLGFDREHLVPALVVLCRTCICIFPAIILGLWSMTRMHLQIPLRPAVDGDGWVPWLIYQFMYVAVAEEVFFRGYLQTNVMRLIGSGQQQSRRMKIGIGIVVSAGCFAVAHFFVQGQVAALLTFLPGLLLGWLFVRTHCLLAPILFHGIANVSYGVIAIYLT